ncbi:uncharacterized protein SAPINGB_P004672 [Magnusiomyces paraingens]|uniref:Prefoldin subunit 3 n=1 Tax=Magnusiomyces paraingens TaxID=2606893 RepID=A0A5E8C1I3_9ASCO|nr:uncharacterized protein SAPINGB_P004672 [Saprochaete ingens]VVT55627.1 unnamed protein product [Saprochaete ingens]
MATTIAPASNTLKNFFDITKTNPRGIPQAPFVEKVENFVKSSDDVQLVLSKFEDMIQKYKHVQTSTTQRVANLQVKIPDIEKTLDMVRFLESKKDSDKVITTNYGLNDSLYTKAEIAPTNVVYLWLGANVMLEYTIDEAVTLLNQRLNVAQKSLKSCEEDLEFLRENITTVEVNIARVYNWEVQKRREQREEESSR